MALTRIVFLGTPAPAALALGLIAAHPGIEIAAIVTQPDRPAQRGRAHMPPPVKQAALELGLGPILQPESTHDPAFVEQLAALNAELGIIAAYGEILRKAVLELIPAGYLNIHPSLLPLYRGPTPVPAAILNGDAETGVTVMRLSRKMDAGPILAQQAVTLSADKRNGPLLDELFQLGATLLLDVLEPYLTGQLIPEAQDESQATYTAMLSREDGRIDWTSSAVHIERMTRAYDPWPAAHCLWREQSLRIIRAGVAAELQNLQLPVNSLPGSMYQHENRVLVMTGAGLLELLSVQPAAKRPMPAIDWWRGARAHSDERLM